MWQWRLDATFYFEIHERVASLPHLAYRLRRLIPLSTVPRLASLASP